MCLQSLFKNIEDAVALYFKDLACWAAVDTALSA
jgi:hypothetical protein